MLNQDFKEFIQLLNDNHHNQGNGIVAKASKSLSGLKTFHENA